MTRGVKAGETPSAAARAAGARGEALAAQYYAARGYTLREKNFHTRLGEVDLILEKDGALVFCEVKTRGRGALDAPGAWVGAKKQRRLILAAQEWLQRQGLSDAAARFDVAEVLLGAAPPHTVPQVRLIENAFTL